MLSEWLAERGWREDELIGRGLDFTVVRVFDRDDRPLAARFAPAGRFGSDANDPRVDRRALLRQEYAIARHLDAHDIPVARPVELYESDPLDVLVSAYLPDDGTDIDGETLGRTLARLHAVPAPPIRPIAAEGVSTPDVLDRRIRRRWAELSAHEPALPPLPHGLAKAGAGAALLHLDVRAANVRVHGGRPTLVDWANALIGDPALELARVAEFATMPETASTSTRCCTDTGTGPPNSCDRRRFRSTGWTPPSCSRSSSRPRRRIPSMVRCGPSGPSN